MDRLLSRLERRFGKLAIENLPMFIAGGMGIVFLLSSLNPTYLSLLDLDTAAVARGQVWRLITFLFIPQSSSLLWILVSIYWVYWIGSSLEGVWGAFKLNAYYFVGIVGTVVAAFITHAPQGNAFINYSLLFAFATLFPEYEILLFFILPVKMKWLGWLSGAFVGYQFFIGSWGVKGAILASVANYLLFFSGQIVAVARGGQRQVAQARRRASSMPPPAVATAKVCALCGSKESDGADIRVCACDKCRAANAGSPRELCLEHARNH